MRRCGEKHLPWLPFYAFGDDPGTLLSLLNDDPEAAFIIADGPGKWKAVETIDAFTDRRCTIWHVPSGPLPLLAAVHGDRDGEVDDPWAGWTERRAGAIPTIPYFGPDQTGHVRLTIKNFAGGNEPRIGLSAVEWTGNHYARIGSPADPATERWWKRLRSAIGRISKKVPRGGPLGDFKPEIYALPDACRAFANGMEADINL